MLFSNILFIDYDKIKLNFDYTINLETQKKINKALFKLKQQQPIQYVLKEAWFCGHRFYVDKNVLIPRPETEEIIHFLNQKKWNSNTQILDMGTGSGCIAISIKKMFPTFKVQALEISNKALKIAIKNAEENQAKIDFLKYDFLKIKAHNKLYPYYDLIISNPPYITEPEKQSMQNKVLDYEPHTALFVNNKDPLCFIKKIIQFSKQFLSDGGSLIIEINPLFATETELLFEQNNFVEIMLIKDFGQKERFIYAKKYK